jgi:spermidine/putrescine transport system substrate-binding protein
MLAMVLGGCKKKDDSDSTTDAGGGKKADEINLFAWSEYVPQTVIDGFTEETGIRVNYETYANNEEMLAKLVAGGTRYDLIQPSEYTIEALIKDNRLAPLDLANIPNIKNIDPRLRTLGHDPEGKYSVPWMTGTVCIVVNTDRVKEPIKGFKDVFQEKYKGRIVVLDDNREIVSWALATLGIDPNDVTTENLAKVKPIIASWIPLIKVFDSDSPKTALLNGDVDLGVVWSGEAAILYAQDRKFQFVVPAEGTHMFVDSLCIPKNAPNKAAAEEFINYCLRPDVSKLISDDFPYTNPNVEARKLLSEEQLSNEASYPKGENNLKIFRDIGDKATEVDRMMTDLRAG